MSEAATSTRFEGSYDDDDALTGFAWVFEWKGGKCVVDRREGSAAEFTYYFDDVATKDGSIHGPCTVKIPNVTTHIMASDADHGRLAKEAETRYLKIVSEVTFAYHHALRNLQLSAVGPAWMKKDH